MTLNVFGHLGTASQRDGVPEEVAVPEGVALTLDTMPDDIFRKVIAACGDTKDWCSLSIDWCHRVFGLVPPHFEAVKGLGCLSKGVRQQLHRLQPLVTVQSLAVVQQPALDGPWPVASYSNPLWMARGPWRCPLGPWRVVLSYWGQLTAAVVAQARQGRVRSIIMRARELSMIADVWFTLTPALARRVVPELLGAGCSLLDLDLYGVKLDDTWVSAFGEAAVCSAVLLSLSLERCNLQGSLPELRCRR